MLRGEAGHVSLEAGTACTRKTARLEDYAEGFLSAQKSHLCSSWTRGEQGMASKRSLTRLARCEFVGPTVEGEEQGGVVVGWFRPAKRG